MPDGFFLYRKIVHVFFSCFLTFPFPWVPRLLTTSTVSWVFTNHFDISSKPSVSYLSYWSVFNCFYSQVLSAINMSLHWQEFAFQLQRNSSPRHFCSSVHLMHIGLQNEIPRNDPSAGIWSFCRNISRQNYGFPYFSSFNNRSEKLLHFKAHFFSKLILM